MLIVILFDVYLKLVDVLYLLFGVVMILVEAMELARRVVLWFEEFVGVVVEVLLQDVLVSLVINLIVADHVLAVSRQALEVGPTLAAKGVNVLYNFSHLLFI